MPFSKPCPQCGDEVHIRTLKCPHCEHVLRNSKSLTVRRKCNAASTMARRALETPSKAQQRLQQEFERANRNRGEESPETTSKHRKLEHERVIKNRSVESPETTQRRRKLEHERVIKNRGVESPETTRKRRKLEHERVIINRALESPEATRRRVKLDCERTASRRSNVSIDNAVESFINKTKEGPNYICVSCQRLMYRQTVVSFTKSKYTKAKTPLLNAVVGDDHLYASFNGKYFICRTCDGALSKGCMPIQSLANICHYSVPLSLPV